MTSFKYIFPLILLPSIFPMKHSPSTDNVNDMEVKMSLYEKIRFALLKIDPKALKFETLLSSAIELNDILLDHTELESPDVSFFFAVTKNQIPRKILIALLSACQLDPINTIKTKDVISKYLKLS